jgi:hypothetical protein
VKRLIAIAAACAASVLAQDKFVPLFDGKTLNGWQVCDGKATYAVEDGAIVGRTVEGSPNSFLCTTKDYGDFVLELETKTDPVLNSGIQLRAHKYTQESPARIFNGKEWIDRKFPPGRVYGYQVEVTTADRGVAGGVYDEARRGWLYDAGKNDPAASKAFKDNEWNKYRIEARGDSIKVWVNGILTTDLVDPLDQTGFIGLQVHSFKGPHPAVVRWRNIRIQDLGRHEWQPIWDSRTFDGWTTRGGAKWTIEDGVIHGKSTDSEAIGFVVSDLAIKDATVRVKFKIASGNSGFFVRAEHKTLAGYEVEIDAQKGTGGFWEVGGRRWVTGPEDNAAVKSDDWNDLTASVHGDRIVFHLNGLKTVDLPKDTQGRKEGHIAIQAHGSKRPTEVWFKDIAILQPVK